MRQLAKNVPIDVTTRMMNGHGGTPLAVHEMGEGQPLLLLHGLFSDARTNWIKFGTAATLSARGFRVIMPDLRVHGQSAAPRDAHAYPADVLALDIEALVGQLELEEFDLGGFSLGARTAILLLTRGMKPRRAILAGMGLEGLSDWARRRDFFLSVIADRASIKHGDPRWLAVQFMKTMKIDSEAAALLLKSGGDVDLALLPIIDLPVLVVCGTEDRDNGDPRALAAAMPDARFAEIPGTHMGSVTHKELGQEIADFLVS